MTEETQVDTDPALNIVIRVSEVNTILAGLQELPFKIADPLLKNIINQAQTQLNQVSTESVSEEEA